MPSGLTIHLIRHGESEANLDRSVNARLPDHRVPLSARGYDQAVTAGRFLATRVLGPLEGVAAYVSPHRRTRGTWTGLREGMEAGFKDRAAAKRAFLESGDLDASRLVDLDLAKRVRDIPAKESIHLRELEFGLFDGIADADLPTLFPREHAHYANMHAAFGGEFYARMPSGESRCDVAQRVHQCFGTLLRDHERHGVREAIVVSHGITVRAFAMMWMGLPVEWMEGETNPGNCSIRSIRGKRWIAGSRDGYVHGGTHRDQRRETADERREEGRVK